MDNAASINVAVRIRPATESEAARLPDPLDTSRTFFGDGHLTTQVRPSTFGQLRNIIAYEEDGSLIYDPMDPQVEALYRAKGYLPPGTYRYKHRKYQYDQVFGPKVTQQEVFERTTRPLLDGILDGYNGTVFAYGATGCGKTHTISGTPSDPGIIYATMAELFQRIEERREDYIIDVSLSFLEIYNEEIRDLLVPPGSAPRGGLAIREDSSNRVTVAGLMEVVPKNAAEVNSIVQEGNTRRTQSPTHANATSSRSHAVLQINVTQRPRTPGITEECTMATLSIIDLAGSERASATKNMGKRMVEGANINKSLLALGNCINALCEPKTRAHIPYRNSKLTRLLKFSLGGNCRTVMIVCVAPTSKHLEDTGNTLAYANRAKEIKTKVSKNIMDVDRHVGQYVEAINRLNDEVRELKAKLAGEVSLENEAVKRRRLNAVRAVEAIRTEIRDLAAKSKTMLCSASFTAGNTAASHAKLAVIRSRLRELEASPDIPAELESEKCLLNAIIAAEEATISKEADTIARGNNTAALFSTNIGMAQKRKGDDWDELAPTLIKLEGDAALAEMRAAQAEHERDGMKAALEGQAKVITMLVGMLARTNTLINAGAQMIHSTTETPMPPEDVASRLLNLVEINEKTFTDVIGTSIKPVSTTGSKNSFSTLAPPPSKKRTSLSGASRPRSASGNRRTSLGLGSPPRRVHGSSHGHARAMKSPRRMSAMRTSASTTHKSAAEKKSVRWAVPIKPDESYVEPIPIESTSPIENTSAGATAESEWEDDPERTDESTTEGASLSTSLDAAALSWSSSSGSSVGTVTSGGSSGKNVTTQLSSLKEENEPTPGRKILGDLNQASASRVLSSSNAKAQKQSTVGPTRSDRPRRRSSLIPKLSPSHKGSPKPIDTPSNRKSPKKPKRNSLLGALTSGRMRPSLLKIGVDPSTNSTSKPTWK
ncbi:kinesin-like protein Klp5 [Serendipita sp. 411]|nr:kinesin-like protein Klp5 [Serendipita sp. 398]KAG8818606.1 kinesin-like protein Klp5 [Serendipita sp. 401]KAG8854160.1 kinesin-like protein Klp5 [Serendipita sp. 411]KAG8867361.1 kinesin-like protein Klp5 [Serendipita sp. 405]